MKQNKVHPDMSTKLPSKQMDYILNYQKYFYVTYVMHYMIITYFIPCKYLYVRVGFSRILKRRTKEERDLVPEHYGDYARETLHSRYITIFLENIPM